MGGMTPGIFIGSKPGLVPNSAGGTTNFLRADGTFAVPPGGGGSSILMGADGITTNESTTSTAYTDLATVGPVVTLLTGAVVYIALSSMLNNNSISNGTTGFMGVAVSGATVIAANTDQCVQCAGFMTTGFFAPGAAIFKLTGLTPGNNTFTAKYRSDTAARQWNFFNRKMVVWAPQ